MQKSKLRKDGQPRQKPGPKPKTKPLEVARLGPSIRRIQGATAQRLEIVDSHLWPGREASPTVESAMEQCSKAYSDCASMMLQNYKLKPGELPTPAQAKQTKEMCAVAYRCALPTLKAANVQAYIACVAQGVSLDVFTGRQGSQLLYAAQVSASSMRNSNKP